MISDDSGEEFLKINGLTINNSIEKTERPIGLIINL